MPCNIGYKNVARIRIPAPKPLRFESKAKALQPDAELLERLGVQDPTFVEWIGELDTKPLLREALKRALTKIDGGDLKYSIAGSGELIARGEYRGAEARALAKTSAAIAKQWQIEVLNIVLQLLDYETQVSVDANQASILEGEKHSSRGVHEFVRISQVDGRDTLRFEHFASAEEAAKEQAKFLVLAQTMGIKIDLITSEESGQPIPTGTVHRHFLSDRQRSKA